MLEKLNGELSHPWTLSDPVTEPELTVTCAASNADEATVLLREVYHDLNVSAPSTDLRMQLRYVDLSKVKLVGLKMTHSTVVTQPFPYYVVATTLAGRAHYTTCGTSRAIPHRDRTIMAPGASPRINYLAPSNEVMTISLDPQALEDELSALLGRPVASPIRFYDMPDRPRDVRPFDRALTVLGQELTGPSVIADQPKMSGYFVRLLMAGLLLDHPHNYSEELARPTGFTGPRSVRSAVQVIDSDPMSVASVTDLARRANVSVRSLEDGFRSHLGISPMRYLRDVRLVCAHDTLRRSDPDSTTATAIAHRWGFNHYGRFVSEYRAKFGRTPAETLRSDG